MQTLGAHGPRRFFVFLTNVCLILAVLHTPARIEAQAIPGMPGPGGASPSTSFVQQLGGMMGAAGPPMEPPQGTIPAIPDNRAGLLPFPRPEAAAGARPPLAAPGAGARCRRPAPSGWCLPPEPVAAASSYAPPYPAAGPYPPEPAPPYPANPVGPYPPGPPPTPVDPAYNYLSSAAAYYPQPVDYATYSVPYYNYTTTNNVVDGPKVLIGYIINVTAANPADIVTATRGVFPYGTYPAAYQPPPPPRPTNYVPLPPPQRRPYRRKLSSKSQPIQITVQAAPPAAPVVVPAPAPAPHPPYYGYYDSGRYPQYPGAPGYRGRPPAGGYNDGSAGSDQFDALGGSYLPPGDDDQWAPAPSSASAVATGKVSNAPYNYYRNGR
ncbi:basic proline-rich protein-like [Paramacrobiotus metropolitanus]|uniref:basic proline-rich protein-like n=1 Tax=Paramacrobiotus metropolitanus TaxID=2943436 RepID=UPI002446425A|nr:basic proline-rich protein-like [Paramacrobiotus metropolitanus]